jgi:hypothetical protein
MKDQALLNDHMSDIGAPFSRSLGTILLCSLDAQSPKRRDVIIGEED